MGPGTALVDFQKIRCWKPAANLVGTSRMVGKLILKSRSDSKIPLPPEIN